MNRKFLLCRRCGNLIELINDSGVTPICCGIDMVLLTANSTEAATEKHIPVIEKEGTTVKITIGETFRDKYGNKTSKLKTRRRTYCLFCPFRKWKNYKSLFLL